MVSSGLTVAYASMGLATARFKTILDNFDGVRIEASSNIKILGNNITRSTGLQNSDGIYIDVSEGVTIQGNEISMVAYTTRIRDFQITSYKTKKTRRLCPRRPCRAYRFIKQLHI
ncbi:right-handed parallel beta-helix repeat-containing protein [Desulfurococcus amylolyticus]|uniref:right-handed parallel beta-helix repeat-containing protein n=1 Tax=Desulfurococcus amylolyticus TaxID=94694 RepID=UPI0012EC3A86